MRSRSSEIGLKEYAICFIVVLAIYFGFNACHTSVEQGNWHTEIVTVCDKGSVETGSGDSRSHEYRVYTTGQTYKIESFGYRVPALSRFWNIKTIELTQQEPAGTCQLTPSN